MATKMSNIRKEYTEIERKSLLEKSKAIQLESEALLDGLDAKIMLRENQIDKDDLYYQVNQQNHKLSKELLEKADQTTDFLVGIASFIGQLLKAVPIISVVFNGAKNIFYAANTWSTHEGIYTKGVKTTTGIAAAGLIVASLVLAFTAPELGLAIAAIAAGVEVFRELWIVGAAIKSLINGSWSRERAQDKENKKQYYQLIANNPDTLQWIQLNRKLEVLRKNTNVLEAGAEIHDLNNQIQHIEKKNCSFYAKFQILDEHINKASNYQIHRNGVLASKTHLFVLNSTVLIGAAFLATPLAPLGAAILIATSIYGILHGFDFPMKWASRVKNYFFGNKKSDSVDEILIDAKKNGVDILKEHAQVVKLDTLIKEQQQKNIQPTIVLGNSTTTKISHGLHVAPHFTKDNFKEDETNLIIGNPRESRYNQKNSILLDQEDHEDDDGDSEIVKPHHNH